jgi:phage gp16-like protein
MGRPLSSSTSRKTDLAMIHMAASQLGLRCKADDSAYRDMLWTVGRVRSAADLDAAGREAVLNHMRACGWKSTSKAGPVRYEKGTPAALIRWLWSQLHAAGKVQANTDIAMRRYIAQHAGLRRPQGVTEVAPQHLDRRECNAVIEQLKRWLERPAEKETEPA